jgi:hypothetical protein
VGEDAEGEEPGSVLLPGSFRVYDVQAVDGITHADAFYLR